MATGVDLAQVAHIAEGVGAVASTAPRNLYLAKHAVGAFKDGDLHWGHHLFQAYCAEEACGSSANDCSSHLLNDYKGVVFHDALANLDADGCHLAGLLGL